MGEAQARLTFAIQRNEKLILELNDEIYLLFTSVKSVTVGSDKQDDLIIGDYLRLVIDAQENTKEAIVKKYDKGSVRFVWTIVPEYRERLGWIRKA